MNDLLDIYVVIRIDYNDDYKDKSVNVCVLGKYKNYDEAIDIVEDDTKKELTEIILDYFYDDEDEYRKYILISDYKLNKYSCKSDGNKYITVNFEKFELNELIEKFISGEFVDYICEWQVL